MNGNVHVRLWSRVGVATPRLRQRGDGGTQPSEDTWAGQAGPEPPRQPPCGGEPSPRHLGGRQRVASRSPVREYCTPGSVRGASGNWRPYRDGFMV